MLSVQEFIDQCRGKGLNVTYQRILIYKALRNSPHHPTAEDIYQGVKLEYPSISLATVYKTLETLAEHRLISKVTQLHDLARFDSDTSHHHHLICLECRKVMDIHDADLNRLELPTRSNFRVHGYRIQFEGVCENCEMPESRNKTTRGDDPVTFCGKSK